MIPSNILRTSYSWQDFCSQIEPYPEKEKGDCFEALTEYYLRLDPKYVTLLKHVWALSKVPISLRDYLNLPSPDEGIDLIAETNDGEFWSIQCKYLRDENASLNRRNLSTFFDLSFNICKHIRYCLVCTSADRFSHKLTLYGERLGLCPGDVWRGLDAEFFNRLHCLIDGKAAPLVPLIPRSHQKLVVRNALTYYVKEGHSRGKLLMPCGSGKTISSFWLAQKLNARTILVAAPSLALIRQTIEVWAREFVAHKLRVDWIAVCSDESVGEMEADDVTLLTQDFGIQVDTDPEMIARWLKGHNGRNFVVFTTYQSGRVIAEAARRSKIVFDVGILDEAHKTVGRKDNLFSHLLFDENVRIKKRVFMTATERRYLGQSEQIVSMDDEEIYGETFELLSFNKALEARPPILSDYKVITIGVTQEEIASLIKRNLYLRPHGPWNADVEAEMLAAMIALRKAMSKHRIDHAVSFHSTIRRARVFKETMDTFTTVFPDYGPLNTFHVFGSMPTAARSAEMSRFATSSKALVTNAKCLTEGVDVPNIDGVLFADPKKSTIDIVQAVGRALRLSVGKSFGYVIVPVLLGEEGPGNKIIQQNAFANILTVLRALGANDERIIKYFRGISQGRRPGKGNGGFSLELPEGMKINVESFVKSLELRLWSRLAKLSWRPFEEARAFVHLLRLKTHVEWMRYCIGEIRKREARPFDIPTNPYSVYKDLGWVSWGDWIGTGRIAFGVRKLCPFDDARRFVRGLALKSGSEWRKYCRGQLPDKRKKPEDIPTNPHRQYKNEGWVNMGDWLGTGTVAPRLRLYRSFLKARSFVHQLGFRGEAEWRRYCRGQLPDKGKKPEDIPAAPSQTYSDMGWVNMGDWLGTGTVASYLRKYRPFEQARAFVHSLALKNQDEWNKYCRGQLPGRGKKPEDIPAAPQKTYRDMGWVSVGDWLGTQTIAPRLRQYRSFKDGREFVRNLHLRNQSHWYEYCDGALRGKGEIPEDIPKRPDWVYRHNGWSSWGDWLGTGTTAHQLFTFRSFQNARNFVRGLGLASGTEWRRYCRGQLSDKGEKPEDIPTDPSRVYKDQGWSSWGDWLGTGTTAHQLFTFRSFQNARNFVRGLGLASGTEWRRYYKGELRDKGKKPEDIPH